MSRKLATWITVFATLWSATAAPLHAAQTALADYPVGSTGSNNVPANVLLVPSVEFPTAVSQAHLNAFDPGQTYIGYFDPYKCYDYDTAANNGQGAFVPRSFTIGVTAVNGRPAKAGSKFCSGKWSGNYLNWATMPTIDTFRWTLTGGDRTVDTATETIIRKAFTSSQGGEGNFNIKGINSNITSVTPLAISPLNVRIYALGTVMHVGVDVAKLRNGVIDAGEQQYTVAVRVCVGDNDPTLNIPMLEDNCAPYAKIGGKQYYKPEGLIQQNADRMRFGVFSYMNVANNQRDGAVLRARMKFVGPNNIVPGSTPTANTKREWDPATGVLYANPDPVDASNTGVTQSGVINYINEFGTAGGGYETYDNVSELYYAAMRYLRNKGNVPEWSNGATAAMKDGFPVITDWDDPILYSCQKNFTIGIGDVNTWTDRNVPGGTNPFGTEPTMPASVSADVTDDFNIHNWTNTIGSIEGLGNIGDQNGGCCSASYYIAGLAYRAHTKDIRPDLPEKQTVDFYWVDVLEYQTYRHRNQYWLAAKYGGFVDDNGDGKPQATSTDEGEWRKTNNQLSWGGTIYKLPDNYFVAANPKGMVDGLSRAFQSINAAITRNAGLGAGTADISQSGTAGYVPSYEAKGWTGNLVAKKVSSTGGTLGSTTSWNAQAKLETQAAGTGWQTRSIVTGRWTSGSFAAIPFTSTALNATELGALSSDATVAGKLVDYLRGDRSNEGTLFRTRDKLLGSIVDSAPAVVAAPNAPYDEGANPGYTAFRQSNQGRRPLVLVGANDGMLHAFDGDPVNGGNEQWAYIPSELLQVPASGTNGLANFAANPYAHRYLMNGPIRLQDVDLAYTNSGGLARGSWRTIAIAGMGKGGRTYTAIDVTAGGTMTGTSTVQGKVLWEFTHANLGYTFGMPRVFKTKRWGWTVAIPSGYNNADGKGYVFLLDAANGNLLAQLRANEGSADDPLGLAHIGAYVPDLADFTADTIYGGDLKGNVWRWDIGDAAGDTVLLDEGVFRKPTKIAVLKAPNGTLQPVTTEPEIQSQAGTQDRFIFIGTGRYLDASDTLLNQTQSVYAIRDGRRWAPWQKSSDLPSGLTWPLDRSEMQQVTSFTSGITYDNNKGGWYYDLTGGGSSGANERIIVNPVAFGGIVAFPAFLPAGEACSPGGTGALYAASYSGARSQFSTNSVPSSMPIVKATIVSTGDRLSILATLSGAQASSSQPPNMSCSGELCQIDLRNIAPTAVNRLNVREIRPDR